MYPNKDCDNCNDCPEPIVPTPIPDLSHECGNSYNYKCVKYTGEGVPCLGIITGMTLFEIFEILNDKAINNCCTSDCVLSDWSEWSACDDQTGLITRTRTILRQPSTCGLACGPLTETQPCSVDCSLSEWSAWSECVDGSRTRTRTVVIPPLNGGDSCGPLTETEDCCLRPSNLNVQSYLTYQWNSGLSNYPFSNLNVNEVCSQYVVYKAEGDSTNDYQIEAASIEIGQPVYIDWNEVHCDTIPNGNYWYVPDDNSKDFSSVSDIFVITVVSGIITDISNCPLLPLSLINNESITFDIILSDSPSYLIVDWGDDTNDSYYTASTLITISHVYSTSFTGQIRIRSSLGNENISEFKNFIIADTTFNSIAFNTSELGAFTGLTKFICTDTVNGPVSNVVTGDIANLPSSLERFICAGNNTTYGLINSLPSGLTFFENRGFNITSGNIANLPVGLTGYINTGSNTTTGNISSLPSGLLNYTNNGLNTTSGNINSLPSDLIVYDNRGNNTTTGDIVDLPFDLATYINHGFNTTYGNINNLKTALTYYNNIGYNITSGDIDNLKSSLKFYLNWGNNETTGDIADLKPELLFYSNDGQNTTTGNLDSLPVNLTHFTNIGNNTVFGDISLIPNDIIYFSLQGGANTLSYTLGRTWAENMQFVFINPIDGTFDPPEVDDLLIDLSYVGTWTNFAGVTPKRIFTSENRTSASDTAVDILSGNHASNPTVPSSGGKGVIVETGS